MEVFGFHECSHKLHDNKLEETIGLQLSWLERTPDKGEVGSSSLPRPTNLYITLRWNNTRVRETTLRMKPPLIKA